MLSLLGAPLQDFIAAKSCIAVTLPCHARHTAHSPVCWDFFGPSGRGRRTRTIGPDATGTIGLGALSPLPDRQQRQPRPRVTRRGKLGENGGRGAGSELRRVG